MKKMIYGIVGPTASGKSGVAIELAKKYGFSIISCDSMQIYRGMNVGTAKVTEDEKQGVAHYLLDFVNPKEDYSLADYFEDAKKAMSTVIETGKTPLFCGGTGLYMDAVIRGSLPPSSNDETAKQKWTAYYEKNGGDALFEALKTVDPESAEQIHKNNVRRVIRALEIYEATGKPKSVLDKESQKNETDNDFCIIGLSYSDMQILYDRINKRVDQMMTDGLLAEVTKLKDEGLFVHNCTAAQSIGYKEFLPYFQGQSSLCDCVEQIKLNSRHYAKRQMTWFRAKPYVHWIACDGLTQTQIIDRAEEILRQHGKLSISS